MDVDHDLVELRVGLLEGPLGAARVLLHLQAGGGHATRVGSLAGGVGDARRLQSLDRLGGGGHVRALGDQLDAVLDEALHAGQGQLVLGRAGQGHVAGDVPDGAVGNEHGTGALGRVVGDASTTHLLDVLEQRDVDAGLVHDVAGGVGDGHDGRAQLLSLLGRVDRDITGAGNHDALAVEAGALRGEHLGSEVDEAVTGGLSTRERTAPRQTLAGQDARVEAVLEALVLAEHVADLAATHADVAGGHVGVGADVAGELSHEGLAKTHDLSVGLALGVEVRATLAATHGQAGQGVLEDLLEAEELDDRQVHGGVEAQATLVGAESGVELDAEAAVHVDVAFVIGPRDAELELALGFDDAVDDSQVGVLGVTLREGRDGQEDLVDGLVKLGLGGITALNGFKNGGQRGGKTRCIKAAHGLKFTFRLPDLPSSSHNVTVLDVTLGRSLHPTQACARGPHQLGNHRVAQHRRQEGDPRARPHANLHLPTAHTDPGDAHPIPDPARRFRQPRERTVDARARRLLVNPELSSREDRGRGGSRHPGAGQGVGAGHEAAVLHSYLGERDRHNEQQAHEGAARAHEDPDAPLLTLNHGRPPHARARGRSRKRPRRRRRARRA